jgi:hypothetical protein
VAAAADHMEAAGPAAAHLPAGIAVTSQRNPFCP